MDVLARLHVTSILFLFFFQPRSLHYGEFTVCRDMFQLKGILILYSIEVKTCRFCTWQTESFKISQKLLGITVGLTFEILSVFVQLLNFSSLNSTHQLAALSSMKCVLKTEFPSVNVFVKLPYVAPYYKSSVFYLSVRFLCTTE